MRLRDDLKEMKPSLKILTQRRKETAQSVADISINFVAAVDLLSASKKKKKNVHLDLLCI